MYCCCVCAALCWQIRHHAGLLAWRAQREANVSCFGSDPGRPAAGQQPTCKFTWSCKNKGTLIRFKHWLWLLWYVDMHLCVEVSLLPLRMGRITSPWTIRRTQKMMVSHRLLPVLHQRRSWEWPATLCLQGTDTYYTHNKLSSKFH